jgi:hypothetical protein
MLKPTSLFALLLVFAVATAESKTRADCERDYKPRAGQAGKDVIWWPTDDGLVSRMLKMAKVGPSDTVYDLGAGDGRIAITAAKQFGARAIGIEYEAPLVAFGQCLAEVAGVADRVELRHGDIFQSNFSDATVVTMYLLQKLNLRLRPLLLDMKPGTRVVSHSFDMGDWEPDDRVAVDFGEAYLWIVPAKVTGAWMFRREGGAEEFSAELRQAYQRLSGTAGGSPLTDAKLNGSHIEFAFRDGGNLTRVVGTANGDRIEAKVTRGGSTSAYTGLRR